jgi:hypothetical protein
MNKSIRDQMTAAMARDIQRDEDRKIMDSILSVVDSPSYKNQMRIRQKAKDYLDGKCEYDEEIEDYFEEKL